MRKDYERYLNELYADIYSAETAYDQFCYLKEGKISKAAIFTASENHQLGTLFRRHDVIAFNVGYSDWVLSKKQKVR